MPIASLKSLELLFSRNRRKYCYFISDNDPALDFFRSNLSNENLLVIREKAMMDSDEELFADINFMDFCRNGLVEKFWLYNRSSEKIEEFAKSNNLELISPKYDLQKKLENKIFFDDFLKKNHLPSPGSKVLFSPMDVDKISFKSTVLQVANSHGSLGTFFPSNKQNILEIIASKKLEFPLLCREFINGLPVGVTVIIGKNEIVISALRAQLIFLDGDDCNRYLGIQWLETLSLSSKTISLLNKYLPKLAYELQNIGFRGMANIDFMVDTHGEIFFLECNPRPSLSNVQIAYNSSLIHGLDLGEEVFKAIFKENLTADKPALPETAYQGCTLDLDYFGKNFYERSMREPGKIGIYNLEEDALEYYSEELEDFGSDKRFFIYNNLAKNCLIDEQTDFGMAMTNIPLFNLDFSELSYLKGTKGIFTQLEKLIASGLEAGSKSQANIAEGF